MVVAYSIEIDLYLLFVVADSVDLCEMLYHVAFHQGLQCLSKYLSIKESLYCVQRMSQRLDITSK